MKKPAHKKKWKTPKIREFYRELDGESVLGGCKSGSSTTAAGPGYGSQYNCCAGFGWSYGCSGWCSGGSAT